MILIFIGISPRIITKKIDNLEHNFIQINNDYLRQVEKLGFIPLILSINNIEDSLKLCSGFIISGGDDINPILYNEINTGSIFNDLIDDIDFKIINYAFKNQIPLLGICRGLQVINVFFKGTLVQDFPSHFTHHYVQYKNRQLFVNSSHHQIIKKIGKNLIPIFKIDEVIEAVMHKDGFIFGVQWHPERLDDISSIFIFKYLKYEVIKYAQINERKNTL